MHGTLEQIDDIIDLMIEAHDKSLYAEMDYEREITRQYLTHWINDPKSLVLVNNEITACYIVTMQPSWWSRKPFINDVFLYSRTAGSGFRLMKEAQKWIDGWGAVIAGEIITTTTGNPMVDKMYQKMGKPVTGHTYMRVIQ